MEMRSGVVQGSVLGPLLFVLFVDDIVDLLGTTMGTKLYADDLKLYTRIMMDEPGSLADGLIRLEEWSVKWQLGINESKCSVMHLGNGASNTPYRINQIQLPSVDKVCDLGVTYDNKLSFGDHIGNVVSKAYQRIYLIFRSFVLKNFELLKRAYITYVRPLLEYCTPVWSPHLIKNIEKIENVQRYFTRRLLPKNKNGYTDRLALLGLETLELRRLKFDLKMYYQIIHHAVDLDSSKFFKILIVTHETRSHKFQLQKQVFQNNTLNNSFANRAIDCWNNLPHEIAEAVNYMTFKKLLNQVDSYFFRSYLR